MSLRWGVIGYGRFGQLHAGAVGRADNAELAAIATARSIAMCSSRPPPMVPHASRPSAIGIESVVAVSAALIDSLLNRMS